MILKWLRKNYIVIFIGVEILAYFSTGKSWEFAIDPNIGFIILAIIAMDLGLRFGNYMRAKRIAKNDDQQ